MVKNITIPNSEGIGREILKSGQLQCLGGAHARARSGQDRYLRPKNSAWLIECVIAGRGYLEVGDEIQLAIAGDAYLLGPHNESLYYPDDDEPWEKLFIEVSGKFVDHLIDAYDLWDVNFFEQARVSQHMQHILELLGHQGSHVRRDIPIMLHRLISSMALNREKKSQELEQESMTDYIESRIKTEFSLEQMAIFFNCSKNHLVRLFKQRYQCTPYEYLLRRRVEQAVWIIKHTSTSVKHIASELQFSDNKHLSSTLKRRTGKSPREWRKQ